MSTRQADALRRILAENDVSQVDLATAAHVNKNTLTNILKGGPTSTPVLEKLTVAVNSIRRQRKQPEMDLSEWLATAAQAEALRRTYQVEQQMTTVDAVVQRLLPQMAQLVARELGATPARPPSAGHFRKTR